MILTYKYRLKDRNAAKHLRAMAVAVNQVWNYCNAAQRDVEARYRLGAPKRRWPSGFDLCKLTAGTSADLGINANTINAVCLRYAQARDTAKRALRFRASFGGRRALGWVPVKKGRFSVTGNAIAYHGKTFRFFGLKRRPLPEKLGAASFVEDARGRWYICIQVEVEEKPARDGRTIGIDLGLKSFATTSDGGKIEAPRIYRDYERRLGIAQRAGNKRRARALHAKIANCRRDFLHKVSTELVRSHGLIAVGNVNASKLARTRMAKSVLDAGWSTFRNMLSYKCQQAGACFLEVDEAWTTQTCSECGSIAGPKGRAGLNKRDWDCPDCGAHHDRDVNSALVILARALSAQRPVEGSQ
jgi:putative transposase